MVKWFC